MNKKRRSPETFGPDPAQEKKLGDGDKADQDQDRLSPPAGDIVADQPPADPSRDSPRLGDGQIDPGENGAEEIIIPQEQHQMGDDGKLGAGQEYSHDRQAQDARGWRGLPGTGPSLSSIADSGRAGAAGIPIRTTQRKTRVTPPTSRIEVRHPKAKASPGSVDAARIPPRGIPVCLIPMAVARP